MEKWYADKYRRHLADMHIADWDGMFLSKFDEEEYIRNLKTGHIQAAMIYMQSHIGLCYFPTKVSKEHAAFRKNNRIKRLMERCKEENISVVGYYSLIFNNQAYYDHPSWRMMNERGHTIIEEGQRAGLVCPNNAEYREFVAEQIREFSSYFPPMDGVFYDMPFWPIRCTCKSCQNLFLEETGERIPEEENWKNPVWRLYVKKRQEWMADFSAFVTRKSKEIMPGVTVSQNFAGVIAFDWWAGSTEGISEACDYVGGDLYGDLYNHSFSCKYYYGVTKNMPFEYMLGSCEYNLAEHTIVKTESRLQTEVFLTLAHHGATMLIDAIDLDGRLHENRYEQFGRVFRLEEVYEPYLHGNYIADVAVYYDSGSQFSSCGYPFTNKKCAIQLIKTFIKHNVASAVIANGNFKNLSGYKMIFAPCLESCGGDEADRLIDYVKNGGTLYLSSVSDAYLLKEFFGAEISGMTEQTKVYLRPSECGQRYFGDFDEDTPMSVNYAIPLLEPKKECRVLAKLTVPFTLPTDSSRFASFHSNPPGIKTEKPVLLEAAYGKGRVVWSAAAVEEDERTKYRDLIINLLHGAVEKDSLFMEADCSEDVEIISFRDGESYYISLVDLVVENRKESRRYSLAVRTGRKPKSVKILPDGEPVAFTYEGGRTRFLGEFEKFRMVQIEL